MRTVIFRGLLLRGLPLLLIATLFTGSAALAQLITYTNDVGGALSTVAANMMATSLSRVNGASTPGAPCSSGYTVSGFSTATVYSNTLPAIEVTLTPNTGFTLNVTGFSADLRRSSSGPASMRYAYSTDGGTTWVDQGTDQAPNNASCGTTTTGTWTAAVTVSAPLTLKFRLYGFNAGSASASMQLLNLIVNGSVVTSPACAIPPGLTATFTTTSTATLGWTAIGGALSYNVRYRASGATAWITTSSATNSTTLPGLVAGTIYECQVETVCSSGTSGYSATAYFTTTAAGSGSASSGKINIYFNRPVNTAVSTGVNAVYLNSCMADTLIAYINRAKYTISIAQYSYNQSASYSSIAAAVNNAVARGVRVRWIYDGSQANTGLALLSSSIPTLGSPTTSSYGIMHHKYVIIDANSTNPNDAVVSTGSEDWGVNQFNNDYNNILFIQDSALAHAYLADFNQMWGDTGMAPNSTLSKFGPFKADLGRHFFTVGGKTIELYFSPVDHTDNHIQSSINSANTDLYFGVFTFTMSSDANAIVARQNAGVYTAGIVDENSTLSGSAYTILSTALGSMLKTQTGSTIYHSKMMVVDPSNACSDPQVLTGSHNWTNAADTKNDENIIIIHNDTIANIYYQSFSGNYADYGGTLNPIAPCSTGTSCGTPSALFTSAVGTTTAILNWAALGGATSYNVQYRPVGSTTWSATTSSATSVTITGLTPATSYEFQVQAVCASGTGAYSSSTTFSTQALPCSVPTGLTVTGIDTNTAAINWVAVSGAVSYNVQYRISGATTWITVNTLTNSLTLTGLAPATTYDYQVEVVCASGTSGYSAPGAFTTDAVPPSALCPAPGVAAVPATVITDMSAVLHWTASAPAVSYNVRYRPVGTTVWFTTSTGSPVYIAAGLSAGTNYEFQVQANCGGLGMSAHDTSSYFTTLTPTNGISQAGSAASAPVVFPNPASGNAHVYCYLGTPAHIGIAVQDMLGRELYTSQDDAAAGEYDHTLQLKPGIYTVRITVNGGAYTSRLVVF